MKKRIFIPLLLVLHTAASYAQSPVPAAGIAAESAGEWTQCARHLQERSGFAPHDAKLWVRIADIEARLGNVEGSAAALRRAIQEAPLDANLHQRLSQAYAVLQQPLAALEAIEHALALTPDSVDFLRARGTWPPGPGTTIGRRTPIAVCPPCNRATTRCY